MPSTILYQRFTYTQWTSLAILKQHPATACLSKGDWAFSVRAPSFGTSCQKIFSQLTWWICLKHFLKPTCIGRPSWSNSIVFLSLIFYLNILLSLPCFYWIYSSYCFILLLFTPRHPGSRCHRVYILGQEGIRGNMVGSVVSAMSLPGARVCYSGSAVGLVMATNLLGTK